jgi:hypothetical protein
MRNRRTSASDRPNASSASVSRLLALAIAHPESMRTTSSSVLIA